MAKTINTRIQLKSDTELNWRKSVLSIDNEMGTKENVEGARSFVPQKGEAIIFEPDNEHSFSRLKIGDGITNVLSLPFIDAGTTNGYIVRKEVPSNAEFTDTTYSSGSGISIDNNNNINHTNSITPSSNSEKKVYKITYDSEGHITNAEEINVGTVKSVQIQASSPLQSSSSNLQTESLNTTISFIAQDKNTIFAGPTESATDTPSFRSLIEDDIPNLSASKITGTFSAEQIGNLPASKITSEVLNEDRIPNLGPNKISGVIPVSKGGTGVDGINGDSEHNVSAFINNGIFAYDSINARFKQFGLTTPGNTDTFTSYVNSLNGVTGDLIVDLNTLIKAVPPINLNNPRDITQNYINSYYAPKTKGWKNSVLISQGEENFNEGTEPIWLNPTALSAEGFHGGALFYGRYSREVERIVDDETVTSTETGFETQWGTLPVEQGGTGVTNFDNNIDKVLITAINSNTNAQYFSTITKTSDSMANTLVLRDSNSNFATNIVTISSGINTPSYNNLSNVITISNGVSTHYGNLAADNLTATIGTIEMSKISSNVPSDLPIINWYKSILDTKTKIGSIYWTIDSNNNGQASFVNISNDGKTETYLLPSATSTTDTTYKILTTKNTLNGALYVSTDGSEPSWGTLPIAQGGTGVTTLYDLFNEIKGTGLDNLGDATWVNVTGDTITGQLILNRATALTSDSESNGALIIGTTTNVHLAFDTDSIMAKNNTSVATLFINEFGGNVNILQASDDNYFVNIRSTKSSTSSNTGALVVSGGLGIGGTIYGGSAIYAPSGNIWAGTDANTTAERQVGVQSGAGQLYLFSQAATNGNRGLYIPAHGTGAAKDIITIDTNNNVNFYGNLTGNVTGNLTGNASTASLLKPIASTTTESASTWNIPSGSKQVWGERFSDTTLKYTNSNDEQVTITDTGDWTIWLTPNASNNEATLNMRIDGTYYGSFNGNITGNLYPPVNGGIYWDKSVESSTDSSDVTSIYQIATGVAGGTELRISQQNDSTDVINLCAPYYIYLNSKRTFTIYDSWLRINEDSGFSSGIYTGNSLLRTDAQLQVGGDGVNFYANNSGNGYFSNTLGIAGTNTSYKLYVNGSSLLNGDTIIAGNVSFGNSNTSNYISIHGLTGDAASTQWANHYFIGNRHWADTESSELILFAGNDIGNGNSATTVSGSGPDRIRMIAAAHIFQTYTSALSGAFETVTTSSVLKNIFEINTNNIKSSVLLHLYGTTIGNTATDMISGTAGLFSWGDTGPKITFDTSETPGGGQAGALIFTDHDAAGTGVSWHFVSNQGDWNVTSKRFHARTSISIGQNLPNTSYNLYVNGTTYLNGSTTVNGNTLSIINNNNTLTIGSQNTSWTHIYSSANIPFIFNNRVCTTAGGLGNSTYPWSELWLNGAINYKGTAANYSAISFKDSGDAYGLGVIIGAGGLTCVGGGESAGTVAASISSGGSEQLCLSNDGGIDIYTGCQDGINAATHITIDSDGTYIHPHKSVSYIAGAKGSGAALYAKKNYNSDAWYPAVALETKGGGAWQIGNYNDETLEFQYATKADRDSNTNSTSEIYMRNGDTGYVLTSGNYGSHTHSYLPLSGGTMTGNLSFSNSGTDFRGINYGTMGDNDQWRIGGAATASNSGYMEIATADDGNEPIYVRQYTGVFSSVARTLTLLNASGNTEIPGQLTVSGAINSGSYILAATYVQARQHMYLDSGHLYLKYNNTWYNVVHNHANGNVSYNACGGGLYIGYNNTTLMNWLNGKMGLNSNGTLTTSGGVYSTGLWANQGTGEHQVGVDAGTSGNLYLYANTSSKGLYSNSGYQVGSIIQINSSGTSFYGTNFYGKFGKNSDCLLSTSAPVNDQVLVIGFKALRNLNSSISANDQLAFIVYSGSGSGSRKCKLWNVTQEKTVWQLA